MNYTSNRILTKWGEYYRVKYEYKTRFPKIFLHAYLHLCDFLVANGNYIGNRSISTYIFQEKHFCKSRLSVVCCYYSAPYASYLQAKLVQTAIIY